MEFTIQTYVDGEWHAKANPTLETLQKIGRPFGLKVGFVPMS